jgi:hypothetical protein
MTYRYEDLGDERFQRLVATLVLGGASGGRAMPLGQKDGGRDIVDADGWVNQVKFSGEGAKLRKADNWVVDAIDGEKVKILKLVARGTRAYRLVTNVGGTGALDVGTIDKVSVALRTRAAAWGLEELDIWWRDDIDARFAAASASVKLSFARALPPDEQLILTLLSEHDHASKRDRTLRAYLAAEFDIDQAVRFEQAELHGPTVDRLFVDVPVLSLTRGSVTDALLDRIGSPHTESGQSDDRPAHAAGAARLLLHPDWQGHAVIVGGPGQGKTTLTQLLCQFHRARHLGRGDYLAEFVRTGPVTALARVPIRIDLRRYARWATTPAASPGRRGRIASAASDDTEALRPLELYIVEQISSGSGGHRFEVEDLTALAASRPMLLALDGLDEVANIEDRDRVTTQISLTTARLTELASDLVVLVTTRPSPGAATPAALSAGFARLSMQRLTEALRLRYLDRWAEQAGLDSERTAELRRTFVDKQNLPHVRELASNPMQLAILLHLLQRRGILPEQRTELYSQYVQVFLDREAPKERAVKEHRGLIEELHGYLAYHLQTQAELGTTTGAMPVQDVQRHVEAYLSDKPVDAAIVTQLFNAVTARVICLVQREAGSFEFEVQPLREYFAAKFIFSNAPLRGSGNTRDDCLHALLQRPYWSNVLRFFAGMLSKTEVRALPSSLKSAAESSPFDRLPTMRRLATLLLQDQVFLNQATQPLRELVDVILEGPGAVLAARGLLSDAPTPLALTAGAGHEQLITHLQQRLVDDPDPRRRTAFADLLRHAHRPRELSAWWWSQYQATDAWLRTAGDLKVLSGLTAKQCQQVVDAAAALDPDEEGLLELLLRSQSDAFSDALLAIALEDASRGFDSSYASNAHQPWSDLARETNPAALTHRHARPASSDQGSTKPSRTARSRHRPRRGMPDVVQRLHTVHGAQDWQQPQPWVELLHAYGDVLGDSWLGWQAALVAPEAALRQVRRQAGAPAAKAAQWVLSARQQGDDVTWWQQPPSVGDSAEQGILIWAGALFTIAKIDVLCATVPQLNAFTASLPPRRKSQLLIAVADHQAAGARGRQRDVRELLRSGQLAPDPYIALLLYVVAFPSSQEELAKIVLAGLEDVLPIPAVSRYLPELLQASSRKVPFARMRGGPDDDELRHLLGSGTISVPSTALAREVLSDPHLWPTVLVNVAIDKVSAGLRRLPALAVVAEHDDWFPEVPRP